MASNQLAPFEPSCATGDDWRALHVFRRARHAEDAIDEPLMSDQEYEHALQARLPLWQRHWWLVWHGGSIIANLSATTRRAETPEYAEHATYLEAWIGVLASHQRQHLATRLLTALAQFMQSHGKAVLSINARTPAGHAFLRALGAEERFLKMKNRLDLAAVDWPLMRAWSAPQDVRDGRLYWEVYAGRVPFSRWEELIEPMTELPNQQPLGELEAAPMRYEMPEIRHWYQELDRTGGQHFMVILIPFLNHYDMSLPLPSRATRTVVVGAPNLVMI